MRRRAGGVVRPPGAGRVWQQAGCAAAVTLALLATGPDAAAAAVDRAGPELAVAGTLLRADGAVVDARTLSVDPVATDRGPRASGIGSVELTIDGRPVRAQRPLCAGGCERRAGPARAWRIATADYGDGPHRIAVTATDAAGNTTTEEATVRFAHATPLPPDVVRIPGEGAIMLDGAASGDALGTAVANVGDVDGDGREDVLVGAPGTDRPGRRDAGAAYLVPGEREEPAPLTLGEPDRRVVRLSGARAGDAAGTAVGAGGDVNGDGYRDVLIGSPGNRGAVHVVFGGPRLRSTSLRRLGRRGLTIRGPATRTGGFGAALAQRRLGDFAVDGDVDGDGLDDVAIGDAGAAGGRGTTFVVFGQRGGGTVDADHLGPTGYRIAGARAGDRAGTSVAVAGDVDHDGRGDLLLTAPGAGRTGGGAAYLVHGRRGGDQDLATLGTGGLRVLGAPGDVLSDAGTVGDVDGDSTPDLLLGGRSSAVVFAQPGTDVDLAGAFAGFRVAPPGPDAGPAQVMGAGDLDGDYAPDAAFGFPDAGAAYVVYSPLDESRVDLAALPGNRGARLEGAPGSATGHSLDGLDALGAGVPTAGVGQPGASPNGPGSGSVALVAATGLAGTGKPVPGCLPDRLWSFPLSVEHVLPRCRRATHVVDSPAFSPSPAEGQIARYNPEPACGAPSRTCQPTAYRSGNARLHGPEVDLATDAVVDLVDSYGTRLAAVQRTTVPGAEDLRCFAVLDRDHVTVGTTCDPTGDPPVRHTIDLWVQGRACMATKGLEDSHYLIRFVDPGGDPVAAFRELQGFVRRDQLTLGSGTTTPGGAAYNPQELAEAAYSGCGPRPPKRRPVPIPSAPPLPGLPTGDRLLRFEDRYVSNQSFAECEGEAPPNVDPACYGALSNYQTPTLAMRDPQLPTGDPREGADWAALTVSSTAVSGAGYPGHPQDGQPLEAAGGGLVRAIVPRDRPFTALDGFDYADPNVPCDTLRRARWAFGLAEPRRPGERPIYGWTAFRDPQGPRERNGLSPGCP